MYNIKFSVGIIVEVRENKIVKNQFLNAAPPKQIEMMFSLFLLL